MSEKKIDYSQGIYDARQLGTPKMLILGCQHMFAMFGATVSTPSCPATTTNSTRGPTTARAPACASDPICKGGTAYDRRGLY